MTERVYLDHAATSFPKPTPVIDAMRRWYLELGVSATRGDGDRQQVVAAEIARVRRACSLLCGVPTERVAFTSGATESIHLFFDGVLREGMRIVTTEAEHSSIVRPLVDHRERGRIILDVLPTDRHGVVDPDELRRALTDDAPAAALFAFTHASNVTGAVLPAEEYIEIARQHDCITLCDASQTAGLLPIDCGADAVVASAHKALLGPPGLGILAVQPEVHVRATKLGGTGSSTALDRQPEDWPIAFESGTANTPAIFGLGAALDWIAERGGIDRQLQRALGQLDRLLEVFSTNASDVEWTRHGPADGTPRLPIASLSSARYDPLELGALFAAADIDVRTGFHCAPWMHRRLGTDVVGGTLRISPGSHVSDSGLERFAATVRGL